MNHLAALLNVLSDIDIPTKLSHEIFESYLGQYFQLVEANDDMKVSDKDFEYMQEVAFSLGISEKEFEKIMTEEGETEEKEETKSKKTTKAKKDEKEEDDDLPEVHDDVFEKPEEKADETDMTNHINRWFGGDNRNNTNFLF